jgi:hypothetical protein
MVLLPHVARLSASVPLPDVASLSASVLLPDVASLSAAVLLAYVAGFRLTAQAVVANFELPIHLLHIRTLEHVGQGVIVQADALRLRQDVVQTFYASRARGQVQQVVQHVRLTIVQSDGQEIVQSRIVQETVILDGCNGLRRDRQGGVQARSNQQQASSAGCQPEPSRGSARRALVGTMCQVHLMIPHPCEL